MEVREINLDEFINKLLKLQDYGYGNLIVRDYTMDEVEVVKIGIHTDYNSGDETNTIIIE